MKRTNTTIEREIIRRIASGEPYKSISEDVNIPLPTIKKIKKRNEEVIQRLKTDALEAEVKQMNRLTARTNYMIAQKLDRAERDEETLLEIAEQYREGALTRGDYLRRRRGLRVLSIRELLSITNAMNKQVQLKQK